MKNLIERMFKVVDTKAKNSMPLTNSLKTINATVVCYDEETKNAAVYLADDATKNTYKLCNKSCEVLSEGDSVKVYYTTNIAKGWIGMRMGEPILEDKETINKKIIVQSKIFSDEIPWSYHHTLMKMHEMMYYMPSTISVDNNISVSLYPEHFNGINMGDGDSVVFNGIKGEESFSVELSVKEKAYYSDDGEYLRSEWTIYSNGEENFTYTTHVLGDGGMWCFNYDEVIPFNIWQGKIATDANNDFYAEIKDLYIEKPNSEGTVRYGSFSGLRGIYAHISDFPTALFGGQPYQFNKVLLYGNNPFVIKLKQYKGNVVIPDFSKYTSEETVQCDWGDGSIDNQNTHQYTNVGYHIVSVNPPMDSARRSLWQSSMSETMECNAKDNVHMLTFPRFLESIDFPSFVAGSPMLETVWLSSTAKYINISFRNCTSLQVCPLPPSVETLGDDMSFRNTGLRQVTLPKTLVRMPDFLYADCQSLKTVTVSCSLGNYTFSNCKSLSSLSFPSTLSQTITIDEGAFYNCKSLSSVAFKSYITEIGHLAFVGTGLKSVSLNSATAYYSDSFPPECKITGGTLIS